MRLEWHELALLAGAAALASVLIRLWISNAPDVAQSAGLPIDPTRLRVASTFVPTGTSSGLPSVNQVYNRNL